MLEAPHPNAGLPHAVDARFGGRPLLRGADETSVMEMSRSSIAKKKACQFGSANCD
jgi:hypothetical protein